ncbi:MAG: hypothetical protein K2L47_00495, partial [Clostridia bacterium]|nr:hypothetical protein [Clostridia bacterium]
YKKNKDNFKSKQIAGLYYLIKSDKYNNLVKSIRKYAYTKIGLLEAEGYYSSEPLSFENKLQGEFVKLKKGTIWAKNTFDCMWMHCVGHVNENVGNIENIKCRIDIGGEGLIYDTQGNALQGITTFVSEFDYALGKPAKLIVQSNGILNNGKIEFWIDAAANDLFGKFQENAKIKCLEIVKENCEIRALAYDMEVLISACDYLDIAKAKELYRALGQVYKKCKFPMTEKIASECRQILKPLFNKNENICDFEYSAIGHGHLDLAWLWPIRESYRKGLRTFSTQIMNMEKYEDYYFWASQAQLFDWIKSLDKNLFSKIHNKVEYLHI